MLVETLVAGRQAALKLWPQTPSFYFGGAFLAWDASAPPRQQWTLESFSAWSPLDLLLSDYLDEDLEILEANRYMVEWAVNEAFPGTELQLEKLGCNHGSLLHKPIANLSEAMEWVASYWNGATPLFDSPTPAEASGEGKYLEVTDVAIVEDEEGQVRVGLLSNRRSIVIWGEPGTVMESRQGEVLGPRHPVSIKAYRNLAVTS